MRSIVLLSVLILLFNAGAAVDKKFEIAFNKGDLSVAWKQVSDGVDNGKGSFFKSPAAIKAALGSYIIYEVKMGVFTDWIIPAVDNSKTGLVLYDPKNVLGGGVRWTEDQGLRDYTYSPISPFDEAFEGFSKRVSNYFALTIYGSSAVNFVKDGARNRLIAWGIDDPTIAGGCCWNDPEDKFGWGKTYSIVGHVMPLNYLYLTVINAPTFYFLGQKVGVKAVVADIFMRTAAPDEVLNWELKREDTFESVKVEKNGMFSTSLLKAVSETKEVLMTINVNLATSGNKTLWPTSKGTKSQSRSFTLPAGVNIIAPCRPIDFNTPITTMLSFRTWSSKNKVINYKYEIDYNIAIATNYFGSDKEITPKIGVMMPTADNKYVGTFNLVKTKDGKFGNMTGNASNTFQYFAFAVYNPVKQAIPIAAKFPAGAFCFLYLGGVLYDFATPYPSPHLEYPIFEKGWYQAIIKFVNKGNTTEGFQVSFEASGLAFNEELLDTLPFTPTPIPNNKAYDVFDTKSKTTKTIIGFIFTIAATLLLF